MPVRNSQLQAVQDKQIHELNMKTTMGLVKGLNAIVGEDGIIVKDSVLDNTHWKIIVANGRLSVVPVENTVKLKREKHNFTFK